MIGNHLSNVSDASINDGEQAKIIYVQRSTAPEDWDVLADPGFDSPPAASTPLMQPIAAPHADRALLLQSSPGMSLRQAAHE